LSAPDQEWAIDFASDVTASGQRLRIFSVVDAFTRECLALETDTSLPSRRITRVLQRVIGQRGAPQFLRSDNGPEMSSRHYLAWCSERHIATIHIQPGKPMQNGQLVLEFVGCAAQDSRLANRIQHRSPALQPSLPNTGGVCAAGRFAFSIFQ
jgi:transposase InsO family protein